MAFASIQRERGGYSHRHCTSRAHAVYMPIAKGLKITHLRPDTTQALRLPATICSRAHQRTMLECLDWMSLSLPDCACVGIHELRAKKELVGHRGSV